MKRILLNSTTYIGPLSRGNIGFYSLYKTQLYIISEQKLNFLLKYLKISMPEKSKIGFDITTWLYKKNLLNENLLCEISSKVINVPKDFSGNDVYYYMSNKSATKNILDLFRESLINSYIYRLYQNNQEEFFDITNKHFNNEKYSFDFVKTVKNIYSEIFSDSNNVFSKEIKKFNSDLITLKNNFFFERICRSKDVFYNNTLSKQYFFPKRQNLEFFIDENFEINIKEILEINEKINAKITEKEKKFLNKTLYEIPEKQKIFKISNKTNFKFLNFQTLLLLILLYEENYIYNHTDKKDFLTRIFNSQFYFVKNQLTCIEPTNSAYVKFFFS